MGVRVPPVLLDGPSGENKRVVGGARDLVGVPSGRAKTFNKQMPMIELEHMAGALVVGNLGLIWRMVASAKAHAAREMKQNLEIEHLKTDIVKVEERLDARTSKTSEQFQRVYDKLDALTAEVRKANGR